RATREDERGQVGQLGVELVDPGLEPVDVGLLDPQRRVLGVLLDRGRQVRAGVEEVVLHRAQDGRDTLVEATERDGQTDRRVGLVAVRVRHQPGVVLAHTREVGQTRGAVVTGAGIDLRQMNSHVSQPTRRDGSRLLGSGRVLAYCGRVSGKPTSREESFLVRGGKSLNGEITVAGAKNSVLKLMAVALMA